MVSVSRFGSAFLSAFLVLLLHGSVQAQAVPPQVEIAPEKQALPLAIAFAYEPPLVPGIVVRASLEGKRPLLFILDTGANAPLALDTWVPDALGLVRSTQTVPINGKVTPLAVVESYAIQGRQPDGTLGSFTVRNEPALAAVADLSFLKDLYDPKRLGNQRIAGIIGINFFRQCPCRFDFAARMLTLLDDTALEAAKTKKPTAVALEENTGRPFVKIKAPGAQETSALVDTGADSSALVAASVRDISAMEIASATKVVSQGLGRRVVTDGLGLKSLTWGGVEEANARVTLTESEHGIVGMNVLSRHPLILDWPHHTLYIESHTTFAASEPGATDIHLYQYQNAPDYYVESLSPVAAASGLKVDDKILRVDDLLLAQYAPQSAQQLVSGLAGRPITLQIERNGQVVRASFVRGVRTSSPGSTLGLLFKITGQGLAVAQVVPGASAATANLKPDDRLVAINGQRNLALNEILTQLDQPQTTLTLQRGDTKTEFTINLTAPRRAG